MDIRRFRPSFLNHFSLKRIVKSPNPVVGITQLKDERFSPEGSAHISVSINIPIW